MVDKISFIELRRVSFDRQALYESGVFGIPILFEIHNPI